MNRRQLLAGIAGVGGLYAGSKLLDRSTSQMSVLDGIERWLVPRSGDPTDGDGYVVAAVDPRSLPDPEATPLEFGRTLEQPIPAGVGVGPAAMGRAVTVVPDRDDVPRYYVVEGEFVPEDVESSISLEQNVPTHEYGGYRLLPHADDYWIAVKEDRLIAVTTPGHPGTDNRVWLETVLETEAGTNDSFFAQSPQCKRIADRIDHSLFGQLSAHRSPVIQHSSAPLGMFLHWDVRGVGVDVSGNDIEQRRYYRFPDGVADDEPFETYMQTVRERTDFDATFEIDGDIITITLRGTLGDLTEDVEKYVGLP